MELKGSLVAIVTPMDADGHVDLHAFESLVDWHCQEGTDGLVVLGTTGESNVLSDSERSAVIKSAVKAAAHRLPVIVGTGTNNTAHSIELTKTAQQLGADGCLAVVPYYSKPPQEGIYQHFKAIASVTDLPIVLYNIPGRTSCDMTSDTLARLSKIKNIVAVKEATGDLNRLIEAKPKCCDDFIFLSGEDFLALDFMLEGGKGVISVTANVAPKLMHDMCEAALSGKKEAAVALNDQLTDLHKKLFVQTNPIPVKWALNQMNLISTGIRLPLLPLATEYHQQVKGALVEAGIINE